MFRRKRKLTVEVVDRKDVLAEHACVAASDLEAGMFAGSLRKLNTADVILVRDKNQLVVLKSRVPLDDLIERLKG